MRDDFVSGKALRERGKLLRFPNATIQKEAHTEGHKACPACAGLRMTFTEQVTPEQTFDEAFEVWIAHRTIRPENGAFAPARYISERTEWDYRQYARALSKMFGKLRLGDLHVGHLREYHRGRLFADGPWGEKAGPNRIRKEVAMLKRMLSAARLWPEDGELDRTFQPLQREDSDVQRVLEQNEQQRFLEVAASREAWGFVLWYTIVALQSCMGTNEMRSLRLGDVSLAHQVVTVRNEGAKNKYRRRTIPLETPAVLWAFERLLERAHELGCENPQHYLFPIMAKRNEYDPSRPMSDSGLKKRWEEVRHAAGLDWLRPYDLRHTAITRYAESGTPIDVIESFSGHIGEKMRKHYTTIGMMAKRKAVASTWTDQAKIPSFAMVVGGPRQHA